MRKSETGYRAILSDGTKVICMFQEQIQGGKTMMSCSRLEGKTLILIDVKPVEDWEWRCPPEPLQK